MELLIGVGHDRQVITCSFPYDHGPTDIAVEILRAYFQLHGRKAEAITRFTFSRIWSSE